MANELHDTEFGHGNKNFPIQEQNGEWKVPGKASEKGAELGYKNKE